MRLVMLSDTHDLHCELDVPHGDVLIHAGDLSFFSRRPGWPQDFDAWLGLLSHRHKIVLPGNHDFTLESHLAPHKLFRHASLLIDEPITIDGLRIWGSPMTPLHSGAFGRSDPADRKRVYSKVPADTDILVTHGPAYGILDSGQGDLELLEAIQRVQPRIHVCGHVHRAYGVRQVGSTMHVNAALLDETGALNRRPIIVDLPRL